MKGEERLKQKWKTKYQRMKSDDREFLWYKWTGQSKLEWWWFAWKFYNIQIFSIGLSEGRCVKGKSKFNKTICVKMQFFF